MSNIEEEYEVNWNYSLRDDYTLYGRRTCGGGRIITGLGLNATNSAFAALTVGTIHCVAFV